MRIVGSPPFIGGLCGDHSPHRTTMTQTKCCPFFKYPLRDGVPRCRSGNGDNRKYFRRSALHFKVVISGCAGVGAACDSAGCSLMLVVLQRVPPVYGRRPGQPSSSSLARRACVHYSGCSSFYCMASLEVRPLALPEVRKRPWPLRRSRGDGNGGRFVRSPLFPSWRGLRLWYAVHQTFSLGPGTVTVH